MWTFIILMLGVTMLFSCSVARFGTTSPTAPKEIDGWTADREVRTFNRKSLFEYIDGGAELYLAYRFHKAYVYRYTKPGEPDIVMDIYDMSTPEDAFGVFTAEREGDDIGIGQGSEYETGLLRFFKGPFFVSILTQEETPQSKNAVFSLATAVASGVPAVGEKPQLVSALPEQGLIENSIRYFYSPTILDLHYYVADENVFLLNENSEAVLARYALREANPYLLVVKYRSTKQAKKAFRTFLDAYMPDAVEDVIQTENGQWTATDLYSTIVTVVFDASSEADARKLLDATRLRLEVRG
jgi:hypothetical protein